MRALAALLLAAGVGRAEPQVLRIATVAPDGTAWARDLKVFAHAVENATGGAVRVKLILGGIAGDEDQLLGRLQRGQLDGAASGGLLCQQLAPSLGVLSVTGLVQERNEASFVAGKLKPIVDQEAARAGYAILATASVGPLMLFSKTPIASMSDLRARKIWAWSVANQSGRTQWAQMGLQMVQMGSTRCRPPISMAVSTRF